MSQQTKQPHKHAELIKEWADGAQIQGRVDDGFEWYTIGHPEWNPNIQYRIKPEEKPKAMYRVALMRHTFKGYTYTSIGDTKDVARNMEQCEDFVRWLTDWIEYEI